MTNRLSGRKREKEFFLTKKEKSNERKRRIKEGLSKVVSSTNRGLPSDTCMDTPFACARAYILYV